MNETKKSPMLTSNHKNFGRKKKSLNLGIVNFTNTQNFEHYVTAKCTGSNNAEWLSK